MAFASTLTVHHHWGNLDLIISYFSYTSLRAQVAQTLLVMCILVRLYAGYRHGKNKGNRAEKKEKEKEERERTLLSKIAFQRIVAAGDIYLKEHKVSKGKADDGV